jgi:hypothetical protein
MQQQCVLKAIGGNRYVYVDQVTLTYTDPHLRGSFGGLPDSGPYRIAAHYWAQSMPTPWLYTHPPLQ